MSSGVEVKRWMERSGVLPSGRISTFIFFVHALNYVFMIFGAIAYVFYYDEPFYTKMSSFQYAISALHFLQKNLKLFFNSKIVIYLLEEGNRFKKEFRNTRFNNFFEEIDTRYQFLSKIFLYLFNGAVLITIIFSLGKKLFYNQVAFPYELHFFVNDHYYSILIFQSFILFSAVYNLATPYLLFFYVSENAVAVLYILKQKMKSDKAFSDENYKLHYRVIRYIQETNKLYGFSFAFEFVLTYIQGCTAGYAVLKGLRLGDPRILSKIINLSGCLYLPFLICFCGQRITQAGEYFFYAITKSNWYEKDVQTRKNVIFMTLVARKQLSINYRLVQSFDYILYLSILRGTFSFLTALQSIMDA